jgi:hypothetical protein
LFGEIPGETRTLPPSVANFEFVTINKCTTGPNAVSSLAGQSGEDIARSLFYMHIEYKLDLKGMAFFLGFVLLLSKRALLGPFSPICFMDSPQC